MKTFSKTPILALALMLGASNGFSANTGSPEAVNIKLYEFWVSPNTDCSDLTRIYQNESADYQNVASNVTFGQVNVPNGTYPCIAFKMGDVIKLTPDFTSDDGHCVDGTEITRDLFRGGDVSRSPEGTTINGSGTNVPLAPVENTMYVYLSTEGDDSLSANIPTAPGKLQNAYVVGGDNAATFVFDFTNGIEDTAPGAGGTCSPEGVTFGFRYQ